MFTRFDLNVCSGRYPTSQNVTSVNNQCQLLTSEMLVTAEVTCYRAKEEGTDRTRQPWLR